MLRQSLPLAVALLACAPVSRAPSSGAAGRAEYAVTLDDFDLSGTPLLSPEERNARILETLRRHGDAKAIGFPAGKNVDSPLGRRILAAWAAAGHGIANHTWSHRSCARADASLAEIEEDVLRADALLRPLPGFVPFFRFPMLKEGATAERRDALRAFLDAKGLRSGYVTIDASDWAIDRRLRARLAKDPSAPLAPYRELYVRHIVDRARYYDGLARRVLGRSPRHVLLLHHDLLNALFLGDVLDALSREGFALVDAQKAYEDPLSRARPAHLPAGESLVWALAADAGEPGLRYPGEDEEYEAPEMDRLGL